jgi:AI-2 transport protein TqsA
VGVLRRARVPGPLAVLLTVLADVAVIVVLIIVVTHSVNEFTTAAPRYQARLQQYLASSLVWLQARGIETSEWEALAFVNPGAVIDLVGTTLRAVTALLSNTFLVLLTMVFILFEAAGLPRKMAVAFGNQPEQLERFERMTRQVQRYLAIKTLISLATGLAAGIWVALMGLGFPLLWGLIAFFFNFIPNLGSIVAAVPPVLLALFQFGPGGALVVALGYLLINVALANFVEPYLMGRKLGLSTLVVFLSVVFWGWVWGPLGMLLAVPLTMSVKIALENTEDLHWVAVLLDPNPPAAVTHARRPDSKRSPV